MKASVIGTGRTGGEVVKLLGENLLYSFDEDHLPTVEKLAESDVIIVFVPVDAAKETLQMVMKSGKPAIWGTTGHQWPEDLSEQVKRSGSRWIIATNFSLGMNLMRRCLQMAGRGVSFLTDPGFHIHEVHHTGKKDAPSGTALSWKEWFGQEQTEITSAREGDVKGIHSLHIKTPYESLHFRHEAHDRAVFAEGAVWAARYLLEHPELESGTYSFDAIIDQVFKD